MKKLTIIISALVLVLGLAQCKKNNVEEKNLVKMTLTATTTPDKTAISNNGNLKWETNDIVNVVVDGVVRGTLSNTTASATVGIFSGELNMEGLTEGQDYEFFFYYIGGQALEYGTANANLSISGQSGTASSYRNFHIASSSITATYNTSGIDVNGATFTTYTAVVKVNRSNFNQYGESNEAFYMYGDKVYESVEIDFSDNTFTPMNDNHYILVGNSGDRDNLFYTLIPSGDENELTLNFVNKRTSAEIAFRNGIQSSKFYCKTNEDNAGIPVTGEEYTEGSLRGLFTVADGTQKHFSQGNLQATYDGSWAWAFAPHQYDAITGHTANTMINGIMSVSENGTVDLFGWNATDGNSTNGINNSTNDADYGYASTLADWGSLMGTGWSTPNRYEWDQVFNGRNVDHHYTMATIVRDDNSVVRKGMILFPDTYTDPGVLSGTIVYDNASAFTATVLQSEWPIMEAAGCVFLPLTCYREGTNVQMSTYAQYWTSTYDGPTTAICWQFGTGTSNPDGFLSTKNPNRHRGCAVRLMCE